MARTRTIPSHVSGHDGCCSRSDATAVQHHQHSGMHSPLHAAAPYCAHPIQLLLTYPCCCVPPICACRRGVREARPVQPVPPRGTGHLQVRPCARLTIDGRQQRWIQWFAVAVAGPRSPAHTPPATHSTFALLIPAPYSAATSASTTSTRPPPPHGESRQDDSAAAVLVTPQLLLRLPATSLPCPERPLLVQDHRRRGRVLLHDVS